MFSLYFLTAVQSPSRWTWSTWGTHTSNCRGCCIQTDLAPSQRYKVWGTKVTHMQKSGHLYLFSLPFEHEIHAKVYLWGCREIEKCILLYNVPQTGCREIEKCILLCNAPQTAIVTEMCCMEPANNYCEQFFHCGYIPFVQFWDG